MNPANLSAKEVLRLCQPETDLEKRLLEIAEELQDDVDGYQSQVREMEIEMESLPCDNCEERQNKIYSAIDLIESGKVADSVKVLKELI